MTLDEGRRPRGDRFRFDSGVFLLALVMALVLTLGITLQMRAEANLRRAIALEQSYQGLRMLVGELKRDLDDIERRIGASPKR